MEQEIALDLVKEAQNGNRGARERLIAQNRQFILSASESVCKRKLAWENDDELSVALTAFNEAVDVFHEAKGAGFFSFARKIITQRLIDFFRSEQRHHHIPLDNSGYGGEMEQNPIECAKAWEQHREKNEQEELSEMMLEFERRLEEYGTSLEELAYISPKHRNAREKLLKVARILGTNKEILGTFRRNKRIPVKELAALAKVSRRVLENGRKYIIALVLILTEPRFERMKFFAGLDQEKGGWQ